MESIAEDMLLNIDEADGDQSDFEESLDSKKLKQIDKKFISAVSQQISDQNSLEELEKTSQNALSLIIQFANSTPNQKISKELTSLVASTLRQRATDLADDKEKVVGFIRKLIEAFLNETSSYLKTMRLNITGAYTLITLLEKLVGKDKIKFSVELVSSVSCFLYFLIEKDIFHEKVKHWYDVIKASIDFSEEDFIQILKKDDKLTRITFLSYLAFTDNVKQVQQDLFEAFREQILNDKEKNQAFKLKFFISMLNNIDEEQFSTEVFTQIEFIMRRSGSLINIVALTLKNLSKVEINEKILNMMTSEILSDEILFGEGTLPTLYDFFNVLSSKIKNEDCYKMLVVDFLLKRYQETKQTSWTPIQRQRLFMYANAVLKKATIPKDKITGEIQKLSLSLMDHIIQARDEQAIKDLFEDAASILKMNASLDFLLDSLKGSINKISNVWQISIFNEVLLTEGLNLSELIKVVSGKIKTMAQNENYSQTVNFSTVLSLGAFFCLSYRHTQDKQVIQTLFDNAAIMKYICTRTGFVNQLGYFKKSPSIVDVKYHLSIIKVLLQYHYNEQPLVQQDQQLRDTLFEYVLNEAYIFREKQVVECFQELAQTLSQKGLKNLFQSFLLKVKQVQTRQKDEEPHLKSCSLQYRVKFILNYLLRNLKEKLQKDEFFTLVQIISNPYISNTQQALAMIQADADKAYGLAYPLEESLENYIPVTLNLMPYFDLYSKELIRISILDRTGILSPNKNLKMQAVNTIVLLGIYGKLDQFIGYLATILNYKALDMMKKVEKIFIQEFDRISYYDLMYYSEITSQLVNVFKESDEKNAQVMLNGELQSQETKQEEKEGGTEMEEEKSSQISQEIDPMKLIALQMKKQASQKKGAAQKKGGAAQKAPVKSATVKDTKKSQQKQEEIAQPVSKEIRNKQDRQQILNYIKEIQLVKGRQIEVVFEAIKRVNMIKQSTRYGYLDTILFYVTQPIINLLHFPESKGHSLKFMSSLFDNDKNSPFFKIKNPIINSLNAVSLSRMFQKNMREFSQIFQHLIIEDFSYMEKGYLQLILLMTNFVLKDLSVNLSVKEEALNVTASILRENTKVQYIDIVRVTINMMKSSYLNDNLSQFIKDLIDKISKEELALIIQRLFDYEPIPRIKFLQQLEKYDQSLFCPVWFSTQLWILQFDEDKEMVKVAKQLWSKYGVVLRNGVLSLQEESNKNLFHYLRSENTNVFEASIRSTVAAIEIFQNRFDLIIDDLIEFYNNEMRIIENQSSEQVIYADQSKQSSARNAEASKDVAGDQRLNRIAVPDILKSSAALVQADSFKKIFEFFITQGCLDRNEHVAKRCLHAAQSIIKAKGQNYAEELLKILEKFINESKKYSEQSKNQAIILIGTLSNYLDNTSQKKLFSTFEKMVEILHSSSDLIRKSITKCIPQIARFFDDKSKRVLEDNFKNLREGADEKMLRGSAYAVSGIIKGLGMHTLKEYDVFNILQKECFSKNADQLRKLSGLYLYETLSISLGKSFELHLQQILPNIQNCISDPKEPVRKAAIQANKLIMSKFSNYAIKQVLPIFLRGLENESWRSKIASVEALGNMAYCAPKQIGGYLPQIVKGIREVLNDTHVKVHDAALEAISNIGAVIKCPEIADILEVLIKALSNPNVHLVEALKVLLNTSFVHAIDAPSLSLLVPILDHGLMMHDNQSKQLASTLMGNICNLTHDPKDLIPYMKILMPAIKNSLFDSIPEIRASAAKALGSLSRGLSLDNSQDILQWIVGVLHQKNLLVSERNGAAQGFAEIISCHGQAFFEKQIEEIMVKAKDKDDGIRESYRGVMVFLPTSYENFVKYLPMLLPIMIEGLSDDIEEVRKLSLRNVKICIKQFGKQAPNQLVIPIMKMMFDADFRVRQSSSILMYQLTKELENDIIKLQPKYITIETKNEILSSMFILKYDTIERVAIQASQIWKNIVDNTLKILRQVIKDILNLAFQIIKSEFLELQEMGLNCMRGIAEKFGDKIVNECLDILDVYLERATETKEILVVSKTILNMVESAPNKLLTDLRNRFIAIVDSNLSHENQEIRNMSAQVVITIFSKTFEPIYMNSVLDKSILKKLHSFIVSGQNQNAANLIEALKEMLKVGPELKLEDKLLNLCNIVNLTQPLTIAQSQVIKTVAPNIAQNVFRRKFHLQVFEALINELYADVINDQMRINEVLIAFSELISSISDVDIHQVNDELDKIYSKCNDKGRLYLYVDLISYYCKHSKVNYESYAHTYMRNILVLINDPNEQLVEKVNKCLNAIFEGLPKESQYQLISLVRNVIEELAVENVRYRGIYKKNFDTLKLLEKPSGVKSFVTVMQNAIMHGSIEIRIDSATCFKYLIDFSKPEAIKGDLIKICGALIRVLSDKFVPELKIQILQTLKLIMLKASASVKTMVPMVQTTFLKAFNDSLANVQLRKLVVDNLLLLIKITPKCDPIVKELTSLIEGDKLTKEQKIEASEALALIIKLNGKAIQQAMSVQIYSALEQIITAKRSQNNDKTIINCVFAFTFLHQHCQPSVKIQDLINSLDGFYDSRLGVSVRIAALISGNPTLDLDKVMQEFDSYVQEQLRKMSGIKEIDGKEWIPYDSNIEVGRLIGSVEYMAFIGDIYLRRFGKDDRKMTNKYYESILASDLLQNLLNKEALSKPSMYSILKFIATIPVPQTEEFSKEQNMLLKQGLQFIKKFYLDLNSKKDVVPALMNVLCLNFDNLFALSSTAIEKAAPQINILTKENVIKKCQEKKFLDGGILNKDLASLATELIFL